MVGKTIEQDRRQRARRLQRKQEAVDRIGEEMFWPKCGWCGTKFNPTKKRTWLGVLICPACEEYPRVILHKLVEYKIVKLRKKSKMPPALGRKRNWGHLGTFDPTRPWMKWVKCKYCTQ